MLCDQHADHCIEPSKPEYLNIFIERPLIQARLLFWLGATQNIQGWLYWATDLWQNCPTSPEKYSWQHRNRTVMKRINGSKYTDFDPASIIWCSQKLYDFWVNGDGCECDIPLPANCAPCLSWLCCCILILRVALLRLHVPGPRRPDLNLAIRGD